MGRSDSRAGGGSVRKLSGLLGQNCSMMTPWGIYMNPRRTGGLLGLPLPGSPQPMVSKKGSASEAPIPFRHVRRLIRKLLFIGCELFLDSAMSERIAGHNFSNECLHTIAVPGDGFHQIIHHDFVVTFKLTAQRIGQQFLSHVAGKVALSPGDDGFQLFGRREAFSTGKFARGIYRPTGIILVA